MFYKLINHYIDLKKKQPRLEWNKTEVLLQSLTATKAMLKKTMIVKFNQSQKFAGTTIIAGRQVYFLTLKNPIYTLKDVIIGSDYGHVPSTFGKWKWTIRTDKRQQVSINPNVLT